MKSYLIQAYDYWKPHHRVTFCVLAKSGGRAQAIAHDLLLPQFGTASVIRVKQFQ